MPRRIPRPPGTACQAPGSPAQNCPAIRQPRRCRKQSRQSAGPARDHLAAGATVQALRRYMGLWQVCPEDTLRRRTVPTWPTDSIMANRGETEVSKAHAPAEPTCGAAELRGLDLRHDLFLQPLEVVERLRDRH